MVIDFLWHTLLLPVVSKCQLDDLIPLLFCYFASNLEPGLSM